LSTTAAVLKGVLNCYSYSFRQ